MQAPLPPNEAQRLESLRDYGILDTPREAAFDDLTRIAAQICGTPMALVSLVDETRQWFKSEFGLDATETPREVAFCAHAILQSDVFTVPDTQLDARFQGNALVTGVPHLRFYAGAPLRTPDGQALGTLCVLDRVPRRLNTDQVMALQALARQTMAQLELRRALHQAERVSRYRSGVMAAIGHDLKQPLQIVQMTLGLLSRRLENPTDLTRLGYAVTAVEKMASELDTLATGSRLGEAGLETRPFPIADILSTVAGNWGVLAEHKGLQLRVVPCSAIVESDPRMLMTILGNLIANAIKYTEAGRVLVGCRRAGLRIILEVWDTGIGIAADQRDAIFESFRQLDTSRSDGLGLGLAIVRGTAELLAHKVAVASTPGKGSRFTVTVPLAAKVE